MLSVTHTHTHTVIVHRLEIRFVSHKFDNNARGIWAIQTFHPKGLIFVFLLIFFCCYLIR